ncbi:MAG: thiamine-phosphate kinase, partial [Gammaproteobacteria bacterium]|nr:thiamine-phosphate kinase [Gammaproteobacteria bacterium]
MPLNESDIINRYFFKERIRSDVVLGIGDDAAVIRPVPGMDIVSAIDTIVEGVHFPAGFAAADIAYRALAVNLSDLAAMSAQPAWALLSLSLPSLDEAWLESFSQGFFELATASDVT